MTEAEENLGSTQEALSLIPEFPYTVLPIKMVSASGCLAVQNGSLQQDANIVSEACNASKKSQDWFLVPLKDNSYQISPGHVATMLLSIRNGSTAAGATAQTYGTSATGLANTRWEIVATAGGTHQLKNINSSLCLSANGAQGACATATKFTLTAKWDFGFSITAKNSNKCLNVADGSSANNANVQQYTCVGANNERWYLQPDNPTNPSYYYFKAKHSNKCLDIAGGSLANNGNAQQYDCVGVTNERWQINPAGDGYFSIVNVNSGKCLTVAGGGSADNTNVDQFTCLNQDNQKWRWNYFAQKTVRLVRAHNISGGGISMTNADWALNLQQARNALAPYGINLLDSITDQNSPALHMLDSTNSQLNYDCIFNGNNFGQMTPFACADLVAGQFPNDIVAFATKVGAGVAYASKGWLQIAGNGYGDICAVDACATTGNDNRTHFAHELGHWFGLLHTFNTAGDDWLGDTPFDSQGDSCLGQQANPPAITNNLMSYYYGCTPGYSALQGAIMRAHTYIKYSNGLN